MDKFDERYDIRLAYAAETGELMNFLDVHWKSGHILSVNRELFDYEFLDNDGKTLHIIIAKDRINGEIAGLCGFLPCSSTEDSSKRDIWGSIWKVKEGSLPFLGMELIKRLKSLYPHRYNIGIGINKNTSALIRKVAFKEYVAVMRHFYMLNEALLDSPGSFKIAKIEHRPKVAVKNPVHLQQTDTVNIRLMQGITDIYSSFTPDENTVPYKDLSYISKRFFLHPIRQYMVYELGKDKGRTDALLILREEQTDLGKVLRIVDYIGEQSLFAELGAFFNNLLRLNSYEYVDFYTLGFDYDYINSAGFSERMQDDKNIIPNYFSPFVAENIDIYVRSPYEHTLYMKADGDQDRPN